MKTPSPSMTDPEPCPAGQIPLPKAPRVAAANEKCQMVAAEHVRIAYSELI
jgi:hypothetical protein